MELERTTQMPELRRVGQGKAMTIISNENEGQAYLHCALCLQERPSDISPQDYARLSVAWTEAGLQVWCVRHDCNVMHVNFEGHCHPANTTRKLNG